MAETPKRSADIPITAEHAAAAKLVQQHVQDKIERKMEARTPHHWPEDKRKAEIARVAGKKK